MKYYREELLYSYWMPFLKKLKVPIPVTDNLDPLSMLIDDADMAAWNNEGLPADRMSYENATILTNCERWYANKFVFFFQILQFHFSLRVKFSGRIRSFSLSN